jgi:hypothetical protein
MVDKNDPLLREVDEALRREQMEKMWERYGGYVLAGAALILAIVGGYKFWEWRQQSLAEAGGAQYQAAYQLAAAGKTDEARAALEAIVAQGQPGYATLAQLRIAGQHLEAGRPKEALAVFESVATNGKADRDLRTFAAIQAASLRLGEADFTEMQNRLNDLANGSTPWRVPARELLGTAAYKAGKLTEARALLMPLLAEPEVSKGTIERVQVVLGSIAAAETAKGATPAPAAATGAPSQAPASGTAPAAPDSGAKDDRVAPAAN